MKIHLKAIFLTAAVWSALVLNSFAADTGTVNLVKPIVAPPAVEALKNAKGGLVCEAGLVLQKNGQCCPEGTNNNLWATVCTPSGTIDDQIFNFNDIAHYCPSADMFIVSDKNWKWFSCADKASSPLYSKATGTEGSKFCRDHGYGSLLKIRPWGTVGCVTVGDSQGDGCIEAGSCAFGSDK